MSTPELPKGTVGGRPAGRSRGMRLARVLWACLAASPVLLALSIGAAPAATSSGGEFAPGDAPCDPEQYVCVDVYEDDPDAITARWDGNEKVWIVEPPNGWVEVRRKKDTVTARRMRLYEQDEYARLEEDVRVVREDARARAQALDLWWEKEDFVFTGDVELIQLERETPEDGDEENAGDSPAEEPVWREARTVWAQRVEYHGATGDVIARENVHMVDDQYRVWADEMVYRREAEQMTFTGRVRVQSTDPDWTMMGEHFFYDLAAEQGHLVGPHRLEVRPRE